jgi:hypothetical protein
MSFLLPGFGLARTTFGPGLFGLARPEKRPEGPCLGLWPGTQDCAGPTRPVRGPGRAVPIWAVPDTGPGHAGSGGPFAHLYQKVTRKLDRGLVAQKSSRTVVWSR